MINTSEMLTNGSYIEGIRLGLLMKLHLSQKHMQLSAVYGFLHIYRQRMLANQSPYKLQVLMAHLKSTDNNVNPSLFKMEKIIRDSLVSSFNPTDLKRIARGPDIAEALLYNELTFSPECDNELLHKINFSADGMMLKNFIREVTDASNNEQSFAYIMSLLNWQELDLEQKHETRAEYSKQRWRSLTSKPEKTRLVKELIELRRPGIWQKIIDEHLLMDMVQSFHGNFLEEIMLCGDSESIRRVIQNLVIVDSTLLRNQAQTTYPLYFSILHRNVGLFNMFSHAPFSCEDIPLRTDLRPIELLNKPSTGLEAAILTGNQEFIKPLLASKSMHLSYDRMRGNTVYGPADLALINNDISTYKALTRAGSRLRKLKVDQMTAQQMDLLVDSHLEIHSAMKNFARFLRQLKLQKLDIENLRYQGVSILDFMISSGCTMADLKTIVQILTSTNKLDRLLGNSNPVYLSILKNKSLLVPFFLNLGAHPNKTYDNYLLTHAYMNAERSPLRLAISKLDFKASHFILEKIATNPQLFDSSGAPSETLDITWTLK